MAITIIKRTDLTRELTVAEVEANFQQILDLMTTPTGFTLKDYKETVQTNATATGAVALNLADGNVNSITLTGNTTLSFNNPASSGLASNLTIIIAQDATGSRTVTWPASVKWAGGTAPTITTTASAVDILTLFTVDGGTTWYGFLSGADMS